MDGANYERELIQKILGRRQLDPVKGCWLWPGATDTRGYGLVKVRGRNQKVHRVIAAAAGIYRPGMLVLHHCDTPACFNPKHLFAGTSSDNAMDRSRKGRGRENRQRGMDNPTRKLSEEDVAQIRFLVRARVPQRQIAAMFGIRQPHVSRIARGRSWRHLTEVVR